MSDSPISGRALFPIGHLTLHLEVHKSTLVGSTRQLRQGRGCLRRGCFGDLEMVSLVAYRHLQIAPGVASPVSEQDRSEAQAMPGTDDLAVTEVLLVYQAAFVRAQRGPDFDLIFALAP